jgi:putative membrane-bound dehydrogenase-like protein
MLKFMYLVVMQGIICLLPFHVSEAVSDEPSTGYSFEVPDGFEVRQVAGPPLVKHPMLGTFDDDGRLFVCASAGLNLDDKELLKQLPNFIRMLEDTNGDGQFDKSTVFADKLTLPSGALWHDGALYVTSPPSLWRLEDTDGDGVADRRDELITGFHFHGHAGDVHGPHLGPDGRLYVLDGIIGHEIHDKDGGIISKGRMARIFSSKMDGSDLQTFCGGGMANPVAATFTEEGELFGATTFFYYNSQDRIRHDAFFHGVYGGVYPRRVSVLRDEFKLTGPLLPPLVRLGMSAPSNLMCYRSDAFGKEYQGNVFISHFNTRRVTRSSLRRNGSTFDADIEPFLVATSPDFHPCDVIEDADGSLLVIDTGGWFKIGCPTANEQPEIHGAIYRVRRKDAKTIADPRGLQVAWHADNSELVRLLGDDRPAVRDRAIATLTKRGDAAVSSLSEVLTTGSTPTRRNAVWSLTRIGTAAARAAARVALSDADSSVRMVAARCAATHCDADATRQLLPLLRDDEHAVRRQAAAALGRIGDPVAVAPLLKSFDEASDQMLEHALIFAMIEIGSRDATLPGLNDASSGIRRAAAIALDQMDDGNLTQELVAPLVKTDDAALQESIVDIVSHRPEWGKVVAELTAQWLHEPQISDDRRRLLRGALYRLRREPFCQQLMADALSQADTPPDSRVLIFQVMADSGFREFPDAWQQQLLDSLHSTDQHVARQALVAIDSTRSGQFKEGLTAFVEDSARPVALRVPAIRSLSRTQPKLSKTAFQLVSAQFRPDAAFETRAEAARALSNAQLTPTQLDAVIILVPQAGPMELPLLLQPLANVWQHATADTGRQLIASLEKSPGFASLSEEQLASLFEKSPADVRSAAESLIQRLKAEYATSLRQVLRTVFNLVGGDPVRGKEIFYGKQALCSSCHRAGPEKENDIGPDLRRIGEVRSPRDLLEAILAPNASIARGYETKSIVTKAGKIYSGVIRSETAETITLYNTQREAIRIPRHDIDEIVPSSVSIMPRGLERSLTPDDLRDLLAWLGSLKNAE